MFGMISIGVLLPVTVLLVACFLLLTVSFLVYYSESGDAIVSKEGASQKMVYGIKPEDEVVPVSTS